MDTQDRTTRSLMDDLELLLQEPQQIQNDRVDISEERTLELLQRTQLVKSVKAQDEVRTALNDSGADVSTCARVLSFIILDSQTKADIRRRAVIDALMLHNAIPGKGHVDQQQAIQIIVQSSPHINLGSIFNPTQSRTINATPTS